MRTDGSQHHFQTYFLLQGLKCFVVLMTPEFQSLLAKGTEAVWMPGLQCKCCWWWLCLLCAAHSAERRPAVPEGRGPVWEGVCDLWPWRDERGPGQGCSHCWLCGDHCRGESSATVLLSSHSSDLTGSWSNPGQPNSEKILFCKISLFSITEHFSLLFHTIDLLIGSDCEDMDLELLHKWCRMMLSAEPFEHLEWELGFLS